MNYTVEMEATIALRSLLRAVTTINQKYSGKRATHAIQYVVSEKFGKDTSLDQLNDEYAKGRFDLIIGRARQQARNKANQMQQNAAIKQEVLDIMTAHYCRA